MKGRGIAALKVVAGIAETQAIRISKLRITAGCEIKPFIYLKKVLLKDRSSCEFAIEKKD